MIAKPLATEHAPYFSRYIDLVQGEDYFEELDKSFVQCTSLFSNLPIEKHEYRYAAGKWTPKEMLMHIIDTERIFAYRALAIARNDKTSLPGFDEDAYALNIDLTHRSLESIIAEFHAVRQATKSFLQHLPVEKTMLIGVANGHPTSARAIAYMIIGHVLHHCNVLEKRYLSSAS